MRAFACVRVCQCCIGRERLCVGVCAHVSHGCLCVSVPYIGCEAGASQQAVQGCLGLCEKLETERGAKSRGRVPCCLFFCLAAFPLVWSGPLCGIIGALVDSINRLDVMEIALLPRECVAMGGGSGCRQVRGGAGGCRNRGL